MKRDAYTEITERFVAALERGVGPWIRPWKDAGGPAGLPENATTGRPYHGVNVFMLWCTAQAQGYSEDRWLTFKQALDAGGNVRKGEKATPVVFWRFLERTRKDPTTGDEKATRIPMARLYHVFNVDQCDGLATGKPAPEVIPESDRVAHAEAFFARVGARRIERGNVACYAPGADEIHMPRFASFVSAPAYYATLAHEHVHWTGHASRLKRDLSGRFGSDAYAAEELVAELGSAFLGAHLEIPPEKVQHPEYLAHWVKVLRADPRALFTAASAARKAADWLVSAAGESTSEPAGESEAA